MTLRLNKTLFILFYLIIVNLQYAISVADSISFNINVYLVFICYLSIYFSYFSLLDFFIAGLLFDLFFDYTLGSHALSYSLIGFMLILNHKEIIKLNLFFQSIVVLIFSLLDATIVYLVHYCIFNVNFKLNYFLSSFYDLILYYFFGKFFNNHCNFR